MNSADTIKNAEEFVEHLRGCSTDPQFTTGLNALTAALARARALEFAVEKAAEWGWCRESREILWGALTQDQERIQKALDQSDGLVAEAIQAIAYVEALREVTGAAHALVTMELQRRNGLRKRLKRADWKPLIEALGVAKAEHDETDLDAFEIEVEKTREVTTP